MSLIFPKKEILYAPMLGTLGGGSARGFGRGAGGLEAYETGLWAMGDSTGPDNVGMVSYDPDTLSRLVTSSNIPCSGSYPSTMADTYRNSTGSVYLVSADSGTLRIWSSSSLNQISATNTGKQTRGMMVYGDYVYWASSSDAYIYRYNISNPSNVASASNQYNMVGTVNMEGMVAAGGYLYFGGGSGYITIIQEANFTGVSAQRLGGSSNDISAMCLGANGAIYAGYRSGGEVRRATVNGNGTLSHTHTVTLANPNAIIEDLEVDRYGNIHVFTRQGASQPGYEVLRGSDLFSITYGNLAFNDPPVAIILNNYVYVADHNGATGKMYKYSVDDVIAGTFSPTNTGTQYTPSTNTLLGSYDQSTIHELNLAQGGLSF